MALKDKMENPLIASLSMLALAAAAMTAFGTITGTYDRAHVNEAELLLSHPVTLSQFDELELKLSETEIIGKCRWLNSEMRALKDSIYVRQRDGGDPDFIHQLEQDLDELTEQYDDLNCTRRLS